MSVIVQERSGYLVNRLRDRGFMMMYTPDRSVKDGWVQLMTCTCGHHLRGLWVYETDRLFWSTQGANYSEVDAFYLTNHFYDESIVVLAVCGEIQDIVEY